MLRVFKSMDRYIALTIVAAEERKSVYQFVDTSIRPDASVQVFTFDDDYSFGVLSSSIHRNWFDERCSKLEQRPRYTPTTVWDTFPWPSNPSRSHVARIAHLSAQIIELRGTYVQKGVTLGDQYDTLRTPGQAALRDLHDSLDAAVVDAFGFDTDEDLLAQLLALNLAAAQDPSVARRPGGADREGSRVSNYRLTATGPG